MARVAYELKRKGMIADGGKVLHALGMHVNSYILSDPTDPRIEAAKPIVVERKIPRTIKPPKPAQDHPFNARIVAQQAHDGAPRVTRPLPIHLTTTAPHDVAIDEEKMSEEPIPYITDVDTFSQEPMEPEADRDIDDELTSLLSEVAALKPDDDAMALASEYVGDQWTGPTIQIPEDLAPKKHCQCNSLPILPEGYQYSSVSVKIMSDDGEVMKIRTLDEGAGAFIEIDTWGKLRFNRGELQTISQVADALIRLHESMDKQNID